jgi:hypothetical protein
MSTNPNTIDLSAVQAEISKLTPEQIKEKFLDLRVRQKVQQKKQQGKGAQKAYQLKQQAYRKALKEQAIALGFYDEINEEADAKADEILTSQAEPEGDETDDE